MTPAIVRALILALALLALPAQPAAAQEQPAQPAIAALQDDGHAAAEEGEYDIITPHITDGDHLEIPYWKSPFYKQVHLPTGWIVNIGPISMDLSPTKHVIFLILAATLASLLLVGSARALTRQTRQIGRPKGLAAGIEAMVLYLRSEVILPNVGKNGNGFVPFLLTLFFFILFANLLGLVPYGATATGNISVTAMLAVISFVVIEIAGMRALGRGYLGTVFYWPHDMPLGMKIPMTLIMTPVEIVGKFTKPFALAIRLFANMTAGHIIVLAFIGLIFTFGGIASGAPFLMAVAIMLLEIFVAFLQAFIFTLLTAVFIGQIREAHH